MKVTLGKDARNVAGGRAAGADAGRGHQPCQARRTYRSADRPATRRDPRTHHPAEMADRAGRSCTAAGSSRADVLPGRDRCQRRLHRRLRDRRRSRPRARLCLLCHLDRRLAQLSRRRGNCASSKTRSQATILRRARWQRGHRLVTHRRCLCPRRPRPARTITAFAIRRPQSAALATAGRNSAVTSPAASTFDVTLNGYERTHNLSPSWRSSRRSWR